MAPPLVVSWSEAGGLDSKVLTLALDQLVYLLSDLALSVS
jgi:hypothetical protein